MEETTGEERQLNALIFKKSVEGLFQKIGEIAEQEPEEAENLILTLSDLLGTVVDRALDLIDNFEIKLLRSQQTGRELFEIPGEDSTIQRLFPSVPFCNCKVFTNQVIQGEEYCCKHYIACRIARALGKVTILEIPHSEFREALKYFEI